MDIGAELCVWGHMHIEINPDLKVKLKGTFAAIESMVGAFRTLPLVTGYTRRAVKVIKSCIHVAPNPRLKSLT